jgi:hypothetical protein
MLQNAAQLLELLRASVRNPIAGNDDKIGCEQFNATEAFDDVVIVDFWSDVQVAYLCESESLELVRETANGQYGIGYVDPMRLDAPSVKS